MSMWSDAVYDVAYQYGIKDCLEIVRRRKDEVYSASNFSEVDAYAALEITEKEIAALLVTI